MQNRIGIAFGCFSYGGSFWWSTGAGSGNGMQAGLRQQPGRPCALLLAVSYFQTYMW